MDSIEVIKFYADWCVPCKVYAREFERATEKLGVTATSINIDDEINRTIVQEYGVEKIPYTVILKDGEPVEQFQGAIAASRLTTIIEKAAQ